MATSDADAARGAASPGAAGPPLWLAALSFVVFAGYLCAVLRYAWATSYFFGDDFQALHLLRTTPWAAGVWVPVGGQIVPLHRLVTFVVQSLAPLRFEVALGVLAVFYLGGAAYLYRILELLQPSRENALLLAVYGTPLLLGSNLVWFTSGMTRFPYLLFTLGALYHYLRYTRTKSAADLAIVVVMYVAALGFYSKAIFIPLVCLGVDAARPRAEGDAPFFRRGESAKWAVIAVLLVAGALYVPGARSITDRVSRVTNLNLGLHLRFQGLAWNVFVHALFDRALEVKTYAPSPLLWGGCTALVAISVVRVRAVALAWLVLVALVSLNFAVVAASNRTLLWGTLMAFETRHYFELMFLVILFLKVALVRWRAAPSPFSLLPTPGPRLRASAWAGCAALLLVHAWASFGAFVHLQETYARDLMRSRSYMRRLLSDVDALNLGRGAPRAFADGPVPTYLEPFGDDLRRVSSLLPMIGVKARFVSPDEAELVVTESGSIVRRRP
jgi:hypothetical protein